jgi:hypothetical protein
VWTEGLDAEIIGYAQNRGIDKLPVKDALIATVKAHQEASKLLSGPQDELIRRPKPDADQKAHKEFWTKLGYPGDPAKYDFNDVKYTSGNPIEPELADFLRKTFDGQNLPAAAAKEIAKSIVKYNEDANASELATKTAALQAEKAALMKNWGPAKESNLFIAKQGLAALGFTPDQINALEGVAGYKTVMEGMLTAGTKFGEAGFVTNRSPNGDKTLMTREAAISRINELKSDKEFGERLLNGGAKERKEWDALNMIVSGVEQAA